MSVYLLKILTPEKRIYESSVISITVTGAEGRLTVLAGHETMAAVLTEGPIIIRTEQETIEGVTGCGMLWVAHNEAAVMVHAFQWAAEEGETPPPEDTAVNDLLL